MPDFPTRRNTWRSAVITRHYRGSAFGNGAPAMTQSLETFATLSPY